MRTVGVTVRRAIHATVIPAEAGIQRARVCAPNRKLSSARPARNWTPAFAGVTGFA
jgi:hypothetical protein